MINCDKKDDFVCIECFHKIKSIFKVYQDGFKDIIECVNFNKIIIKLFYFYFSNHSQNVANR
jgi:hypothetical protein